MTCAIEQKAEATHRRIFVRCGDFCEPVGIRFVADVLGNLSHCVDTPGLMEISCTVEKRQLYTSHVSETFFALDPVEGVGSIDTRESVGRLIEELQTVAPNLEIAQLFGHNDLKDHGSLMR